MRPLATLCRGARAPFESKVSNDRLCLCRGEMADGMSRKEVDVFEEVGVDTDESCNISYRELTHLLPKRRR